MANAGGGILNLLPEGYSTLTQAAAAIGCSPDTLRRWKKDGTLVPEKSVRAGKEDGPGVEIACYSAEDIEAGKKIWTERRQQ